MVTVHRCAFAAYAELITQIAEIVEVVSDQIIEPNIVLMSVNLIRLLYVWPA